MMFVQQTSQIRGFDFLSVARVEWAREQGEEKAGKRPCEGVRRRSTWRSISRLGTAKCARACTCTRMYVAAGTLELSGSRVWVKTEEEQKQHGTHLVALAT